MVLLCTYRYSKIDKMVFVVNAPPLSVGPEWAELPSNCFAVQVGSCQPDLVATTRFLYLSCVENICVTIWFTCIFLVGVNYSRHRERGFC
jgi:hypothetical protein